jgi:hypothetical protein
MNIFSRFRQLELFAASFKKDEASRASSGMKKASRGSQRENVRRRTVRLAVSAFASALSVVVMFFGVVLGVLDLSTLVVASFLVAFCVIEMGGAYPYLVWLVTSAVAFFTVPDKLVFFEYALFAGVYPMLKFRLARLPAAAGWILKLVSFNAALTACAAISKWVLALDADSGISFVWTAYLAGNAMFVLYDLALSSVSAFYILKLRKATGADRI